MKRTVSTFVSLPILAILIMVSGFGLAQDLTVWASSTDPDAIAIYQRLSDEFAAANGIEIELVFLSRADTDTLLRVAIASGEGPDVSNFDVGEAFLGAIARAGLVTDLTDIYPERGWDERVFQWGIDTVTYDGRIWAVPVQQEANGLWYNAALFRNQGWDPPNTWENFIAAATKAKEAGINPIQHTTGSLSLAPQLLASIVYGLIPADIVTDASTLDGSTTWADDPRFLQAVETLVEWRDLGWLPADINALDYNANLMMFVQGNSAMGPLGPWTANDMANAWEEGVMEPVFIPFPAQDTSFPLTNQGAPGNSFFVSGNVDEDALPLALGWIEHVVINSESQQVWLFETGVLPMTVEEISADDFDNVPFRTVFEAHNELGLQGGTSGQWLDHFVAPTASEIFTNGQQRLMAGNWTAEQFIEQVAAATIAAREEAE